MFLLLCKIQFPMKILLKSATIIDKSSPFHLQTKDILIENGVIQSIETSIEAVSADKIIENCHISQGWADSSVCFGEPGYEERETLENGMKVAARSGFTQVMIQPNTSPICDTRSVVSYLKNATQSSVNQSFVVGALTLNSEGQHLAELYDMQLEGAVAFGDYKKTITNANLLKIALQYTQNFGGVVISFANEKNIAGKGVVNEHFTSTRLGLKGIPALAEELIVARDLAILEYTGGKLHIPTISSLKSLEMIQQAKNQGLDVSCSVAIHNILLSDDVLTDFNTNYKVLPPLRDAQTLQTFRKALSEGIIDFVTSDHCPIDVEEKIIEFDLASYGTIGLESAFGVINQYVTLEKAIELLTNAKKRFSLPSASISVGQIADLTLFNPNEEFIFEEKYILSSSKNCAFIGQKMKGKVLGIIVKDKILLN